MSKLNIHEEDSIALDSLGTRRMGLSGFKSAVLDSSSLIIQRDDNTLTTEQPTLKLETSLIPEYYENN